MKQINKDDLSKKKKSHTCVVYGSGSSINDLNKSKIERLSEYDSIGFNWFCKSNIPTSFYLLREQCSNKHRISEDENFEELEKCLKIRKTCYVWSSMSDSNKLEQSGIIERLDGDLVKLKDFPDKLKAKNFVNIIDQDIFDVGLRHGRNSLFSCMHFVHYMGYKNIIFAGVDLNNSNYFWLPENSSRHTLIKKGINAKHKHSTAKDTYDLIKLYISKYNVSCFTTSKKSLLSQLLEIWE